MYYNGCYYAGTSSNSNYCCSSNGGCSSQHCCYCHCCQEAFERGFRLGLAEAQNETDSGSSCCSCSHRTYC